MGKSHKRVEEGNLCDNLIVQMAEEDNDGSAMVNTA